MLVARGLPCPVGLVRGGRRNTLVLKVTFRLDGANVWAGTQAPLRETILDDSGRRVFPSDFQAHKSALDVVIAGATLNALGPVRLRVGRHQIFAEDPRLLGPVPLSDSGRDSSFAWPNQQLPLQEFPLQLEVVFAAARTLLSVSAAPVHAALILGDDWSSAKSVPLNLDALLVDPMREVAEFVFRGFFADIAQTMVVIGPAVFDSRALLKARRWPRAEALEPRARSVRETAYDLDEETFVADAVSDVTTKLRRPDFDEESTAIRSLQTAPSQPPRGGSAPVEALAVEATQRFVAPTLPTSVLAEFHRQDVVVPPAPSPDQPFSPRAKVSLVEETVVNFAVPNLSNAELPFASESTQLLRVALQPGSELPFAKPKQQPSSEALPVELPFQRSASRTMLGGEAGRALPFQSGPSISPRNPSVPPDAGLPFRHPSSPPAPMPGDVPPVLPSFGPPLIAPSPIAAPAAIPPVAVIPPAMASPPVAVIPPAMASPPVAVIPPAMASPPVAVIPPALASPATVFSLDGLTIEHYAKIRSRLWQGEPRAAVLREHKLTELRFRLFEKRLQRDLDALPPGELVRVLELLG